MTGATVCVPNLLHSTVPLPTTNVNPAPVEWVYLMDCNKLEPQPTVPFLVQVPEKYESQTLNLKSPPIPLTVKAPPLHFSCWWHACF
jgi:hypothetical protein